MRTVFMSKALRAFHVASVIALYAACANLTPAEQRALTGGAIGAAAGAALGAVAGGSAATGAAIGGVAGVAGGLIYNQLKK